MNPPDVFYPVGSESDLLDALHFLCWAREAQAGDVTRTTEIARASIDAWIANGLPVRIDGGRRYFDLVHAVNWMRFKGRAGDDLWPTYIACRRRNAEQFRVEPREETFHDPRRVRVERRRTYHLRGRRPGSPVILSLPLPIEEETQRDLVVRPTARPGTELTLEPGMLIARTTIPEGEPVISIEAELTFTAYQRTHRIDPTVIEPITSSAYLEAGLADYLRGDDGFVKVTSTIVALAESLRADSKNPWGIVSEFWRFFYDQMMFGSVYYHHLDADDPLRSLIEGRIVDCHTGCSLLVALCRASRIPARLVHGFLLYPEEPGIHYWAEIYMAPYGWIPFDLTEWTLADGHRRDPAWTNFHVGHLAYQMVLGRLPRKRIEYGVRYPKKWYLLQRISGAGAANEIHDAESGELIFSDDAVVRVLTDEPQPRR